MFLMLCFQPLQAFHTLESMYKTRIFIFSFSFFFFTFLFHFSVFVFQYLELGFMAVGIAGNAGMEVAELFDPS
jgi:hypothetical protein